MSATDIARQNAVEVRKIAYRQSKEGMVISFVIHPQEVPDDLVTAPIGQRYLLAMVRLGDDEQPEPPQPKSQKAGKRRWHDMPASQRAAIFCQDVAFQQWAKVDNEEEAAEWLRKRCGVFSRAHLDKDDDAARKFAVIEEEFHVAVGRAVPP